MCDAQLTEKLLSKQVVFPGKIIRLEHWQVELPNGKTLEIKAPGVSDRKRYVQSLRINGREYDKTYITHSDLLQGGVWEFRMSASPNKRRGTAPDTKPYSLTGNP